MKGLIYRSTLSGILVVLVGCASQQPTQLMIAKPLFSDEEIDKAQNEIKSTCDASMAANVELLDLAERINKQMEVDVKNRQPNNPATSSLIKNLEDPKFKKITSLDNECKRASMKLERMFEADKLSRDRQPQQYIAPSNSINCVSNKIGNTVYTNCN